MGIRKPFGKAAKFAFVSVPAGLIGWQLNKGLFFWLRSFWVKSVNPACPECESGIMLCDEKTDQPLADAGTEDKSGDRTRLYPWICSKCDYAILETSNVNKVREVVAARRSERAQASFSHMQMAERLEIARKHKIGARVFYAFSLLTLINFVYMLANGAAIIVALNWAAFALMFAVFGLKKVYRAWQVTSGHLFETGAFWYWFKHEKWLA